MTDDTSYDYTDASSTPDVEAYDTNGDGIIDSVTIDDNGDGVPDIQVNDTNFDGTPDQVLYDTDGDGVANYEADDTNGDGVIDSVSGDTNADGTADWTAYTSSDDPSADPNSGFFDPSNPTLDDADTSTAVVDPGFSDPGTSGGSLWDTSGSSDLGADTGTLADQQVPVDTGDQMFQNVLTEDQATQDEWNAQDLATDVDVSTQQAIDESNADISGAETDSGDE